MWGHFFFITYEKDGWAGPSPSAQWPPRCCRTHRRVWNTTTSWDRTPQMTNRSSQSTRKPSLLSVSAVRLQPWNQSYADIEASSVTSRHSSQQCKFSHTRVLRRLCMQQPCFQIERIRVMHRRCMLQESSNRSSLGLPCSHVDKHKHTRKHKRKYTPTHTPTHTHTEPFPSSSPFPARCWVCYLALLGLFRATPQ